MLGRSKLLPYGTETMKLPGLKYDDKGLVTAVFQDAVTGEVLTLAYMNEEALRRTLETGFAHVFRRSHGKVMMKGETSGCRQVVKEVLVDCDADALVIKIEQIGGAACHEGYHSCFFRRLAGEELEVVGERLFDPKEVYGKQ